MDLLQPASMGSRAACRVPRRISLSRLAGGGAVRRFDHVECSWPESFYMGAGERRSISNAWNNCRCGGFMATLTLAVNGASRVVEIDDPGTPLLYVLRNDLGLTGTRFGCGLAQCGACTVLVDGRATRSCVTPVSAVQSSPVVTIEGLGSPERPDAVQAAFIAEQAAQCGYCTAGMVVAARALLSRTPHPSEAQVREALVGNL